MANTESTAAGAKVEGVEVARLTQLDPVSLDQLQGLVADSRWNQTADDWGLFHRAGSVNVVRQAGRIVASGAILPMGTSLAGGTDVAWISMILVTPAERARGLGRAVFARCLQDVLEQHRIPMLDATPAGQTLYSRYGFEPLWRLTRWWRAPRPAVSPALSDSLPQLESIAALDRQALGFERRSVLADFLGRPSTRCLRTGNALALVRNGRTAHQIGPLLAADEAAAADALVRVAASLTGAICIDVPDVRPRMRAALEATGFQPQRGFARMARIGVGQALPQGDAAGLHAIAGPEFA